MNIIVPTLGGITGCRTCARSPQAVVPVMGTTGIGNNRSFADDRLPFRRSKRLAGGEAKKTRRQCVLVGTLPRARRVVLTTTKCLELVRARSAVKPSAILKEFGQFCVEDGVCPERQSLPPHFLCGVVAQYDAPCRQVELPAISQHAQSRTLFEEQVDKDQAAGVPMLNQPPPGFALALCIAEYLDIAEFAKGWNQVLPNGRTVFDKKGGQWHEVQ